MRLIQLIACLVVGVCVNGCGGGTVSSESDSSQDKAALSDQSCGAMGGNYCSGSWSCPRGYSSLGSSNDCITCCVTGPSCGDLGGQLCCQDGTCLLAAAFNNNPPLQNAGSTYDCLYCMR